MINDLAKKIHNNNVEKGFYEKEKNIGEMLALIHSEVSEALECHRKGRMRCLGPNRSQLPDEQFKEFFEMAAKDTFADELADIMIRVMDLAAHMGVDLEVHIAEKMRYNSLRPYKHGKAY